MPRRPRGNPKYGMDELKNLLEEACPGITNRIPSSSSFEFHTDNTKKRNVYVKLGANKLEPHTIQDGTSTRIHYPPVWIRVEGKRAETMLRWNSIQFASKINHKDKDLDQRKVDYAEPFTYLPKIQSRPPASSDAQTLEWFTQLRAFTMFAFVLCGRQAVFIDFKKGEGFKALLEVLKRFADRNTTGQQCFNYENEEAENKEMQDSAVCCGVDGGADTEANADENIARNVLSSADTEKETKDATKSAVQVAELAISKEVANSIITGTNTDESPDPGQDIDGWGSHSSSTKTKCLVKNKDDGQDAKLATDKAQGSGTVAPMSISKRKKRTHKEFVRGQE